MKAKALRKLIQQHFKKVAALSELECMFKFFDLLRAHYRFDQERFICALGVSNNRNLPYISFRAMRNTRSLCSLVKFIILSMCVALVTCILQFVVKLVDTRGISYWTGLRYIIYGSSRRNSGMFLNHVFLFKQKILFNFSQNKNLDYSRLGWQNSHKYNPSKRWYRIAKNMRKLALN